MVFANREDFSNRQIPMMSSLMAISHRLKVLIPMIPMKRKLQLPVLNFMAILQKNITKTRPTPFQSIVNGETGWTFWSGGTRTSYLLNKKRAKKRKRLLWSLFHWGQCDCDPRQEQTLYLIPAGVTGPDGVASQRTSDSLWWRGLPWLPSRVVESLPNNRKRKTWILRPLTEATSQV